jgi:hypothetical protein
MLQGPEHDLESGEVGGPEQVEMEGQMLILDVLPVSLAKRLLEGGKVCRQLPDVSLAGTRCRNRANAGLDCRACCHNIVDSKVGTQQVQDQRIRHGALTGRIDYRALPMLDVDQSTC